MIFRIIYSNHKIFSCIVGGNASMRPLFFNLLIQSLRQLAALEITSVLHFFFFFPCCCHLGLTCSILGHPTQTYHFIDRTIINYTCFFSHTLCLCLSFPLVQEASGKSCKLKKGRKLNSGRGEEENYLQGCTIKSC